MLPEGILSRSFLSSSVIKILLTLNIPGRAGQWPVDTINASQWGKEGKSRECIRNERNEKERTRFAKSDDSLLMLGATSICSHL